MIIVKLIGGLGNQLFQYAMARRIAYVNKVHLKLDISSFQNYRLHKYSMSHFSIIEDFSSAEEINRVKKVYEKSFSFNPNFLQIADNVYLEGYWQSEKYFKDIEDIIRKEYTLKDRVNSITKKISLIVKNKNSISIHVRRKDYILNKQTYKFHGVCSQEYYANAIKKIANMISNPYFFIFSDDKPWTKKHLKIDLPHTFVTHNGPDKNYEDLKLMSLCKHHIIANSTFSWWGAWLSMNKNKIVIAPKKWFNIPEYNSSDLIPTGWNTL